MNTPRQVQPSRMRPRLGAFTLIELLVVVGIIALLAGMLLPVLSRVRSRATGIICVNHLRQLNQALLLYANDNRDRLVVNLDTGRPYRVPGLNLNQNWVNNHLTWNLSPDNTNQNFVTFSPLGPFLSRGAEVFLCPSDRTLSEEQRDAGWTRRVRSMALNAMVGDSTGTRTNLYNPWNPGLRQYLRLGDISYPSSVFTFLDENADTISDGYFLNEPDRHQWLHLPGSYHGGAGNLAFVDNHVETRRWTSSSTRRPAKPNAGPLPFPVPSTDPEDFVWLVDRMSERK